MKRVKVQVQPGQTVAFPGICVHDSEPAVATLRIRQRTGRVTREIDVPISASSLRLLETETALEAQLRLASRIIAVLIAALAFWLTWRYSPMTLNVIVRTMLGIILAAALALGSYRWLQQLSLQQATAEKKAVLASAAIERFSWRATTFAFKNETFAERFKKLNEAYLMDIDPLT